jgi:hypothetical protein
MSNEVQPDERTKQSAAGEEAGVSQTSMTRRHLL